METVNNGENIEIKENKYSPKNDNQLLGLSKNTIIIFLFILVVLALLGFNLFLGIGIILDKLFAGIRTIVAKLLTMLGFYTGAVINTTADIVGDTAKETIDIAEGSVQSFGHLLQNRDNIGNKSIEQEQWNINMFGLNPAPASQDSGKIDDEIMLKNKQLELLNKQVEMGEKKLQSDNLQNTNKQKRNLDTDINQRITVSKTQLSEIDESNSSLKWCPIGADMNGGKCISVSKNDKCMFGKVFDDKNECEDAVKSTFTGYKQSDQSINWGVTPPPPPPGSLSPIKRGMSNELPGMPMLQKPCGSLGQTPCIPTTQNMNGIQQPPFKQLPLQYPPQMNGPPPQMNGIPPQMNGIPPQMNGIPPQMNGIPPQMNGPHHPTPLPLSSPQ
jgi:hypothetical protein